ncbi:MAG TPA: radical SAM protein [Myxococcales bacterium]|jgi:radical SAM protein with 4Fe4S-binding SPASM domain
MSGEIPSDLVASRLAVRFYENGRAYLGSLMHSASVPIGSEVAAVCAALWDRTDRRSAAERLAAQPGAPEEPALGFTLKRLLDAGLLVGGTLDEEAGWLERQRRELEAVPRVDQVELTNACPFTCRFCPRGLGQMHRPVGHMDLGLLAEIAAQVKGLPARKPFGLHHFGDPLLHPDPAGAVRVVRSAGLEPELSLNPILLKEAMAEALLEAGVGVLIVSMDGLDTATLQAMRGKAAGRFEQVEKNVETLIGLAARMERPPTIMVSMVATTLNRHQWGLLFERYQRPDLPFLTPVVRLLEDFGEPDIVPLGVRRLRQICGCPYKTVSVLWDGTVVPCCHDADGRVPLGDLKRQSLEQIWKDEPVARLRERLEKHRCEDDEPCARCRWRPDLYLAEDEVADMDAWTPALWPDGPFPPR